MVRVFNVPTPARQEFKRNLLYLSTLSCIYFLGNVYQRHLLPDLSIYLSCQESNDAIMFSIHRTNLIKLQMVNYSLVSSLDSETDFFVLNEERASDIDRLNAMKELLRSGAPYKPVLERDMKVYQPTQRASHFELPSEFYMLTPEEIKKEQQIRYVAFPLLEQKMFVDYTYCHRPINSPILFRLIVP